MDHHSSYYTSKYGNYMLGSLNYPLSSYENACAEYSANQNDPHHNVQQQSTSHAYENASNNVTNNAVPGNSVICSGTSATVSGAPATTRLTNISSNSNSDVLNSSTTAVSATAASVNKVSKSNDVSKQYANSSLYAAMEAAPSYNSSASDMNSYSNGYSSCSKMYDNNVGGGSSGGSAIIVGATTSMANNNVIHGASTGGNSSNNGAASGGYSSNLNYGLYQDLDYGNTHARNANQYYGMPAVTMANSQSASNATRNAHTAIASTSPNVANDSIIHYHQSARHSIGHQYDGKLSAKTSVIKPVNQAYMSTPINYSSKYVAPYPSATVHSNATMKPAITSDMLNLDEVVQPTHSSAASGIGGGNNTTSSNSTNSNSNIRSPVYNNSVSTASNYTKSTEVICPEPIARYPTNYPFAVSTTNSNASSSGHYLSSNSYATYANHPSFQRHQNNAVHHAGRSTMLPTAYQPEMTDNPTGVGIYYNNPHSNAGLLVRPTPSNYPKTQLPYPSAYNYATVATTRSNHHNTQPLMSASTQKPKTDADPMGTATTHIVDDAYDRHYSRSYNAMYNTNYYDLYEDYQYPTYAGATAMPSHAQVATNYAHQTKSMSAAAAAKAMYGSTYGNALNAYSSSSNNSSNSHPQQSQSIQVPSVTTTTITTAMQSTSVITSTPSTQMISNTYEGMSQQHMHSQVATTVHPIVPNPIYGTNVAPGSYPCSYTMYPPRANPNYLSSAATTKSSTRIDQLPAADTTVATNQSIGYGAPSASHHYTAYDKSPHAMHHSMHHDQYSLIDLEEQINSSKILKANSVARSIPPIGYYDHHMQTNNANKMLSNVPCGSVASLGAYRKPTAQHVSKNQQYIYNYNSYQNCYQPQWQPNVSLYQPRDKSAAAVAAAAKAADNLKQNLRDYLSSWNDDEEDTENDSIAIRKSGKGIDGAHKSHTKKTIDLNESPAMVQAAKVMPVQGVPQSSYIQTQHVTPTVIHHDNSQAIAAGASASNMPKIHVGITVDNGGNSAHNLPDIIIDIEKPKVTGETGECFERANVIQELPTVSTMQQQLPPSSQPPTTTTATTQATTNPSEKLYILDSIDVPLADLNKYRHLSVVNKLPDNIVVPTPEHRDIAESDSLKFIDEIETCQARFFKNDFEMNVDYGDDGKCLLDVSDLVECKNMTTVRNVKRIIRKYRKQREYLRKSKMSSVHRIRAKITPPPPLPPFTSLPSPTKAATPASSLDDMPATPCPVDLSANRPPTPVNKRLDSSPLNDLENQESFSSLESLTFSTDDLDNGFDDDIVDPQTLKSMCIKTVNTSEFRDFFTENVMNRRPKVGSAAITIPMPIPKKRPIAPASISEAPVVDTSPYVETPVAEAPKPIPIPIPKPISKPKPKPKPIQISDEIIDLTDDCADVPTPVDIPKLSEDDSKALSILPPHKPKKRMKVSQSAVPSLKSLAMQVVRRNQMQLTMNIRSLNLPPKCEESDARSSSMDANPNAFNVKSLQELAREVANTIYSFNVKPLQDICKLAIEKYDNMFVMHQIEMQKVADDDDDDDMDVEYVGTTQVDEPIMLWPPSPDAVEHEIIRKEVKSLRQLAKDRIEQQLEIIENVEKRRVSPVSSPITIVTISEDDISDCQTPDSLRILCGNAVARMNLDEQSPMEDHDFVPSLRHLCEASIMENGGELPMICFVADADDADTTLWHTDAVTDAKDDNEIYLCLNDDLIEEQLAQIVGESVVESPQSPDSTAHTEPMNMNAVCAEKISDTVCDEKTPHAIGDKIFPSPVAAVVVPVPELPIDDYESDEGSSTSRLCLVTDDIQNNIQYEETVPLVHVGDDFMVKIEPFKKYLQKKYVQTSNYFKMMIIHRLLKKYIVYQRATSSKRAKRVAALAAIIARRKPKPEKKKKRPRRRQSITMKRKRQSKAAVKKPTKKATKIEETVVKPIKIRILKSAKSGPIQAEICMNETKPAHVHRHEHVSKKTAKSSSPPSIPVPQPSEVVVAPTKSPRASKRSPCRIPPVSTATITTSQSSEAVVAPSKPTRSNSKHSPCRVVAASTTSSTSPPSSEVSIAPSKTLRTNSKHSPCQTLPVSTTSIAKPQLSETVVAPSKPSRAATATSTTSGKQSPCRTMPIPTTSITSSRTSTATVSTTTQGPLLKAPSAATKVPKAKKQMPPRRFSIATSTISAPLALIRPPAPYASKLRNYSPPTHVPTVPQVTTKSKSPATQSRSTVTSSVATPAPTKTISAMPRLKPISATPPAKPVSTTPATVAATKPAKTKASCPIGTPPIAKIPKISLPRLTFTTTATTITSATSTTSPTTPKSTNSHQQYYSKPPPPKIPKISSKETPKYPPSSSMDKVLIRKTPPRPIAVSQPVPITVPQPRIVPRVYTAVSLVTTAATTTTAKSREFTPTWAVPASKPMDAPKPSMSRRYSIATGAPTSTSASTSTKPSPSTWKVSSTKSSQPTSRQSFQSYYERWAIPKSLTIQKHSQKPHQSSQSQPSPLYTPSRSSSSSTTTASSSSISNSTEFNSIVNYVTDQIEREMAESRQTTGLPRKLNDKHNDTRNKLVQYHHQFGSTPASSSLTSTSTSIDVDERNSNHMHQHHHSHTNIDDNDNDTNNKNLNSKLTSITSDILERIAKKRIVRRRLSMIDGYRSNFDNYNYDTDEDISKMLSSYINHSIEQQQQQQQHHQHRPHPQMSLSPISTTTSYSPSPPIKTSFERAREKLVKSIAAKNECTTKWKLSAESIVSTKPVTIDMFPTRMTPTSTVPASSSSELPSDWKRMKFDKFGNSKMPASRTKARAKSTSSKHNSQERQIREVCREANRYQRQFLHKFAKFQNFSEILHNINTFYKNLPKEERLRSRSNSNDGNGNGGGGGRRSSNTSTSKSATAKSSKRKSSTRKRTYSSSSDSSSSSTSSESSSSSSTSSDSSTWSNAEHRESVQKCVQRTPTIDTAVRRVRKPIVDMEAMSRQANLCRAYSENIRRNLNLPMEMPDYVMNKYSTHVNDPTASSSNGGDTKKEPFVKLYRSRFIDDLAIDYERTGTSSKSRKRKSHIY